MKDAARLLRKLRRKVYRETPVASWNRAAEIDWHGSYDSLVSVFERGDCGVLSGGAAFALWRAATDAGFRAWCYDFGFPETLTHMVTVIEADGRLHLHDAFFNFEYRGDFYNIIEALRADRLPDIRRETRDRKLYVADPACEAQLSLDWLAAHADRELDHLGALRRFEVLWDGDAFVATCPRIEAVYRDLEAHGHPAELSYLMLHPIAVFDGEAHHRKRETMPLVGGRDLQSPVAGLRTAMHRLTQDLAARARAPSSGGGPLSRIAEAGAIGRRRIKPALEDRRLVRSPASGAGRGEGGPFDLIRTSPAARRPDRPAALGARRYRAGCRRSGRRLGAATPGIAGSGADPRRRQSPIAGGGGRNQGVSGCRAR